MRTIDSSTTRAHRRCCGWLATGAALFAVATGCAGLDADDAPDGVGQEQEPIQGGQLETGFPGVGVVLRNPGFCSGTLISPRLVLTAAHCTGTAMQFLTGTMPGAFVFHPITQVIAHPTKDLMVARLSEPVFGFPLLPLNTGALPAVGSICTGVGFGDHVNTNGSVSTQIKRSCTEQVEAADSGTIRVKMVSGIADHGDSGGPLLCGGAITSVVRDHSDGDWPAHIRENYTTIDVGWLLDILPWVAGSYENWTSGGFLGTRGNFFADVDADGHADAIVVNDGAITVRRSTGTSFGTYENWTTNGFLGTRGNFFADVDADGDADAIVVNHGAITVRRSTGFSFGDYENWTTNGFFGNRGTFFVDVDGDDRADAVVVNDARITVRRSTGTSFGAYENWTATSFFGARGTFFADVDGDGSADAIAAHDNSIAVRRSAGNQFGGIEGWTTEGFFGTRGTFLADVDGDGRADALAVNENRVTVRRSTGGNFGLFEDWTADSYFGSLGTFFADVTGDGKADGMAQNTNGVTVRRSLQ